jgi:hypothetical protein
MRECLRFIEFLFYIDIMYLLLIEEEFVISTGKLCVTEPRNVMVDLFLCL